jgi:type IV secretory pathway TrbD component
MSRQGTITTMNDQRPPTDYRATRRKSDRNLALAVVIFLVGVGGTAIALVYGGGAAALGLVCLLAGAGLFGLVWLILTLMGRWAEK